MGICVLLLESASHCKTVGVWGDKLWGPNARLKKEEAVEESPLAPYSDIQSQQELEFS